MNLAEIRIKELWIYPVKSLGGISLQEASLSERGLQYDRRWMLLDQEGNFLTQRQHAQMALLQVKQSGNQFLISHSQQAIPPLQIPLVPETYVKEIKAPIWDDTTTAWQINPEYDAWFSRVLGLACRLVYMPDASERQVKGKFSGMQRHTSFADDYPILLIGQESLDELNQRLPNPIPMNRFRPNIVTEGGAAFAEDGWHQFSVNDQPFYAEKACARCVVTTIDQSTAKKGAEPLRTLASYRKQGNKVLFGQDVLSPKSGKIAVGDRVIIGSYKPMPLDAS